MWPACYKQGRTAVDDCPRNEDMQRYFAFVLLVVWYSNYVCREKTGTEGNVDNTITNNNNYNNYKTSIALISSKGFELSGAPYTGVG